jgi:hypothetical protein
MVFVNWLTLRRGLYRWREERSEISMRFLFRGGKEGATNLETQFWSNAEGAGKLPKPSLFLSIFGCL